MLPNSRRCISCRKVAPKEAFWRIVRAFPSGTVQLDQGMGRSAYLCPQSSCLQVAQKKNRLGRSLKATVPEVIYQTLWQRLPAAGHLATEAAGCDKMSSDETMECAQGRGSEG